MEWKDKYFCKLVLGSNREGSSEMFLKDNVSEWWDLQPELPTYIIAGWRKELSVHILFVFQAVSLEVW